MAKDLNKVQMTGRLGADPEMRSTPQGHAVITFRVASNRSWRSSEGAAHEDTEWFRVVAWNKLAEICDKWLAKGSRVYVEGRMQTRQWQDQEGETRYLSEVIANDIIILDGRREQGSADHSERIAAPAHAMPALAHAAEQREAEPRASVAANVAALPRGQHTAEEEDLPF